MIIFASIVALLRLNVDIPLWHRTTVGCHFRPTDYNTIFHTFRLRYDIYSTSFSFTINTLYIDLADRIRCVPWRMFMHWRTGLEKPKMKYAGVAFRMEINNLKSTSITHQSKTFKSDLCLSDVDHSVSVIWVYIWYAITKHIGLL